MQDAAKTQALQELLKMVIEAGLLDSLEMPKAEGEMKPEGIMKKELEIDPEGLEEMAEDPMIEDEEEDDGLKPVLSLTQLGAATKPAPKMPKFKAKGKRKR